MIKSIPTYVDIFLVIFDCLLLQCNPEEEFTCTDGTCINIKGRCDEVYNCNDHSDEDDCQMVFLDQSIYRKEYTPTTTDGQALEVHLWGTIVDIDSIQELDSSYRIKFLLAASWSDPRIQFRNLKKDSKKNIVDPEVAYKMWIPPIYFPDSYGENKIGYDRFAYILANKKTNSATLASVDDFNENFNYDGAQTELIFFREYEIRHKCKFLLHYYPFDTQHCTLKVSFTIKTVYFGHFWILLSWVK